MEEKYIKVKEQTYVLLLAYHKYVQNCISTDIIDIPDPFKTWAKSITNEEIEKLIKKT
jgi:hypothetical protein